MMLVSTTKRGGLGTVFFSRGFDGLRDVGFKVFGVHVFIGFTDFSNGFPRVNVSEGPSNH